jgi:hypothetical protein
MGRKFINVGTVKRICPIMPAEGDNFNGAISLRVGPSGFTPYGTPYPGWRNRESGSIAPFAYNDFLVAPIEAIPPEMELGSVVSRMYFGISEITYFGTIQGTPGFAICYENRIGKPIILPEGINPFTVILPWQQISPPLGTDYQQTYFKTLANQNNWTITSGLTTRTRPIYNDAYVSSDGIPYEYNYGYWKDDIQILPDKIPTYLDLVTGYSLDKRIIPQVLNFTPTFSGSIDIQYYRKNKYESIPNLITLDHQSFSIEVVSGIQVTMDVSDIVIGTFSAIPDIYPVNIQDKYPWELMKHNPTNTANLFALWKSFYNQKYPNIANVINALPKHVLHVIAPNNNAWNNNSGIYSDINFDIDHPLFAVDNQRAYDWHVKPQSDNSTGTLIMDSPRVIEIHAALEAAKYKTEVPAVIGTGTADNPQTPAIHTLGYAIANGGGKKLDDIHKTLGAGKYSKELPEVPEVKDANGTVTKAKQPAIHTLAYSIVNDLTPQISQLHTALDAAEYSIDSSHDDVDGDIPRVSTLGWHINRQSQILGIRVRPNGKVDLKAERTDNIRRHVNGNSNNNEQEFNPNCFASKGMLLRHLPNKFTPNGITAGGYRQVKDIPQILAELHEQANSAMGYQEGTAIEIKLDDKTYRYPNQLALLTELFVTAKQTATYSKGAFFSSLIGEQSIKEVIGGLGLRTVDKFIEFTVAKKTVKLYYKGISASQSIRRKLSAVTTNIGIAIGNII